MFFTSGFFWFVMGIIAVLVGVGFKSVADGKGWELNWWKWLLSILWYGIFSLGFLSWGTLIGENEAGASWKMGLTFLVVSIILGVGLWRLLAAKPKNEA